MISGIVLAAGLARRFGSAKPLAIYEGAPLVRHVVAAMSVAEVRDVIVVVPRDVEGYEEALTGTRARTIVNDHPEDGISRSLQRGMDALDPSSTAMVVALADQPTLDPEVVRSLIHEWRTHAHGRPIVAASYRGERGHPVLFAAEVWHELRAIRGDRGARDVIDRDPSRVLLVPIDREMPRDVDTQSDLDALTRHSGPVI